MAADTRSLSQTRATIGMNSGAALVSSTTFISGMRARGVRTSATWLSIPPTPRTSVQRQVATSARRMPRSAQGSEQTARAMPFWKKTIVAGDSPPAALPRALMTAVSRKATTISDAPVPALRRRRPFHQRRGGGVIEATRSDRRWLHRPADGTLVLLGGRRPSVVLQLEPFDQVVADADGVGDDRQRRVDRPAGLGKNAPSTTYRFLHVVRLAPCRSSTDVLGSSPNRAGAVLVADALDRDRLLQVGRQRARGTVASPAFFR